MSGLEDLRRRLERVRELEDALLTVVATSSSLVVDISGPILTWLQNGRYSKLLKIFNCGE